MHSGVLPKNWRLTTDNMIIGRDHAQDKSTPGRDEVPSPSTRSMPRPMPGSKPTLPSTASRCPIVRDEKGYILDGFARAKIAKELGYECPSVTVKGLSEQEKRSQVRALNLARRHLDYSRQEADHHR